MACASGWSWSRVERTVQGTHPGLSPEEQYAHALLLTNEFAFVD